MRWLVVLLLAGRSLAAQQIGALSFRLGDPQKPVLARLGAFYKLTPSAEIHDLWSISDTTRWNGVPDLANVGTVQFLNGVLITVDRRWEASASDAAGAVSLATAVLGQLDGQKNCAVEDRRTTMPEMRAERINIICGEHEVTIGVSEQEGRRYYHLSETWLGLPKPRR